MDLDHVDTGFLRPHRAGAHFFYNTRQLLSGNLVRKVLHFMAHPYADLIHPALRKQFHQHFAVILRMEYLYANLRTILVHTVG